LIAVLVDGEGAACAIRRGVAFGDRGACAVAWAGLRGRHRVWGTKRRTRWGRGWSAPSVSRSFPPDLACAHSAFDHLDGMLAARRAPSDYRWQRLRAGGAAPLAQGSFERGTDVEVIFPVLFLEPPCPYQRLAQRGER